MTIDNRNGFTLIELMVTVAIVGILAAIAFPSYQKYVDRAHRSDAKTILLDNVQFLARNYTENNRYDQDSTGVATSTLLVTASPISGTALYNIAAPTLIATAYTLTATPVVGQRMENDECGALTITHLGLKSVNGTSSVDTCWGK